MTDRKARIDRLFQRRPGQRATALAIGRFVLGLAIGVVIVGGADVTVGVPGSAYLLAALLAAGYGYAGYRKGERLPEE
ncbi:MAG: hypothetical protein ABEJ76_05065 [Halanaeroarchaeum sp.]